MKDEGLKTIVLDTYMEPKEVSISVVDKEVHANAVSVKPDGNLYFNDKLVRGYKGDCEDFPKLKGADVIPIWYAIRTNLNEEVGYGQGRFMCGFDLMRDGQVWCGPLENGYRISPHRETPSQTFPNMDAAISHIDEIVGEGNWYFITDCII